MECFGQLVDVRALVKKTSNQSEVQGVSVQEYMEQSVKSTYLVKWVGIQNEYAECESQVFLKSGSVRDDVQTKSSITKSFDEKYKRVENTQ